MESSGFASVGHVRGIAELGEKTARRVTARWKEKAAASRTAERTPCKEGRNKEPG